MPTNIAIIKFTNTINKITINAIKISTNKGNDETLVIEWTFNGTTYFCDEDTGNLYNQEEEYIGKRCIDKGKFNIKFD